jgi:FdrA protein
MGDTFKSLLAGKLKIVNIGVVDFAESVEEQMAEVIHIDWTPPAGGDAEMLELLDKLL